MCERNNRNHNRSSSSSGFEQDRSTEQDRNRSMEQDRTIRRLQETYTEQKKNMAFYMTNI